MVGDGAWLTPHEAAVRLRVSDNTARGYADAGQVEHEGVAYRLRTMRLPGGLRPRRILAVDIEALRIAFYGTDDPGATS